MTIKYKLTMISEELRPCTNLSGKTATATIEMEHCRIGLFNSEADLVNWLITNRGALDKANNGGKR
jgi:hypothetical protein